MCTPNGPSTRAVDGLAAGVCCGLVGRQGRFRRRDVADPADVGPVGRGGDVDLRAPGGGGDVGVLKWCGGGDEEPVLVEVEVGRDRRRSAPNGASSAVPSPARVHPPSRPLRAWRVPLPPDRRVVRTTQSTVRHDRSFSGSGVTQRILNRSARHGDPASELGRHPGRAQGLHASSDPGGTRRGTWADTRPLHTPGGICQDRDTRPLIASDRRDLPCCSNASTTRISPRRAT